MYAIDTIGLSGPVHVPSDCGCLSMEHANAVNENECRRLSDYRLADEASTDPEIAGEALGYDVAAGEYDLSAVAVAIMRHYGWDE